MERITFFNHERSETRSYSAYLDLCNLCADTVHIPAHAVQSMCEQTSLQTEQKDPQHHGHSSTSVLVCGVSVLVSSVEISLSVQQFYTPSRNGDQMREKRPCQPHTHTYTHISAFVHIAGKPQTYSSKTQKETQKLATTIIKKKKIYLRGHIHNCIIHSIQQKDTVSVNGYNVSRPKCRETLLYLFLTFLKEMTEEFVGLFGKKSSFCGHIIITFQPLRNMFLYKKIHAHNIPYSLIERNSKLLNKQHTRMYARLHMSYTSEDIA